MLSWGKKSRRTQKVDIVKPPREKRQVKNYDTQRTDGRSLVLFDADYVIPRLGRSQFDASGAIQAADSGSCRSRMSVSSLFRSMKSVGSAAYLVLPRHLLSLHKDVVAQAPEGGFLHGVNLVRIRFVHVRPERLSHLVPKGLRVSRLRFEGHAEL